MTLSTSEPPAGDRTASAHHPVTATPSKWKATFGPFTLSPKARLLQRDGVAVRLGGRALDLLIALVEDAGSVISKKDLIDRVWGDIQVDEGSVRFNMYAIRQALGDGSEGARYIVNTANKGYSFVANVERHAYSDETQHELPRHVRSLPALTTSVVGRDSELQLIEAGLVARRLVSIVGPGGIGKTTVAIASAQRAADHFEGDVCYVDLSTTPEAALVRGAVASALGLQGDLGELSSVAARIGDRKLLLILDCCEHVIADAAETAEFLVHNCPSVHVLATSREALRADGEFVYRLPPLAFPPEGEGMTASESLAYPAVRLFVERAAASGTGFELSDNDAPLVSQLCRELDGIALAIELAASRIEALGLQATTSHFDVSLKLMWHGRRTALPRHQTLRATLDWSFDLLGFDEQQLLCKLSVFAGSFSLGAAMEVCGFDLDPSEAIELVASLVSKSLVNVDAGGDSLRYRLLDTTRAYCWGRLSGAGQACLVVERFCSHFEPIARDAASKAFDKEALDSLALDLPNLCAALGWRLRGEGAIVEAAKLAGAVCPVLLQLSKLTECVYWARSALAVLPLEMKGTSLEMHLQAALGQSLMFTGGNVDEAEASFRRGISVAESLSEFRGELHLLNGYSVLLHRQGRFIEALDVARKSKSLLPRLGEPEAGAVVDSLLGVALYFVGKSEEALQHWERSVDYGARYLSDATLRLGFDRHILSLCGMARAMRLAGKYSRAFDIAEDTVAKSRRFGHVITHCVALLWAGSMYSHHTDLGRLTELMDELEFMAKRHALAPYMAVAAATRAQILIVQGDAGTGVERIRREVERLHALRFEVLTNVFLTTMARGLADLSLYSAALATCDEVERRIEVGGDLLRLPELLLVKGGVLADAGDREAAMRSRSSSLRVAREQGSRPGQLRAALAIAKQMVHEGRVEEARCLVDPEITAAGDETSPELISARGLLQGMKQP